MSTIQQMRLANIRMRWLLATVQSDTASWESTFFLQLILELNGEIKQLKKELQSLRHEGNQ
jgi:hypothetical protein